jgi:hypothetical protein
MSGTMVETTTVLKTDVLGRVKIGKDHREALLDAFERGGISGRGRDSGCPEPPAQIPAGGIAAPGSYLECLASKKRCSGWG